MSTRRASTDGLFHGCDVSDVNERLNSALAELHYSAKWLEYGFLDALLLQQQVELYRTSDDRHTEHYRYAAFCAVLAAHKELDDRTVERFIELAEEDDDQVMAQSALGHLVRSPGLTDQQLQRLRSHPAFAIPALQKLIERAQLLKQLDGAALTDDAFQRYVASGDAIVQQALLSRPDVSQCQLELLLDQAANRAIRNVVKDRLRRYRR